MDRFLKINGRRVNRKRLLDIMQNCGFGHYLLFYGDDKYSDLVFVFLDYIKDNTDKLISYFRCGVILEYAPLSFRLSVSKKSLQGKIK